MKRWLLVAALGATACGAGQARPDYPVIADDERVAPAPPLPPRRAPSGALTRQALDETLAAGPGALLARVQVEARRGPTGFRGWLLVALPADTPGGLLPGDVLLIVNRQRVERPEDLSRLFAALRGATELVVEIDRDGAPLTLRIPVVD